MAFWHGTCAISNLPIEEGTLARVLFLVKSPAPDFPGAGCHNAYDLWTPWVVPVLGTYNGIGGIQGGPLWQKDFILSTFKEILVGEEVKDFDELQDLALLGNNKVVTTAQLTDPQPLSMCLILEDVYQALVQTPMTDTHQTLQSMVDADLSRINGLVPSGLIMGDLNQEVALLAGTKVGDAIMESIQAMAKYRRLGEAAGSYGPSNYRGVGMYLSHFAHKVLGGAPRNHPQILEGIQEVNQFKVVLAHMEQLRKLWQPQAGTGSQRGWEVHDVLAQITYHIAHNHREG